MNTPLRSSEQVTTSPAHQAEAAQPLAHRSDLVPWSGVAAKAGTLELALFYLPDQQPDIYAVSHRDPVTGAAVIAHGLVGESQGDFYVASPLHKQQYRLSDGRCLNDAALSLQVYPVDWHEGSIWLIERPLERLPQTG